MKVLRIIDSGMRTARDHLSLTEALCRGKRAGTGADTLRFQHFPPSAIIGRHQSLAREVNLAWCAKHGVSTARRMTGGGAIVMGPGILGWELVLDRAPLPQNLGEVTERICTGLAAGLSTLGIDAQFRPRNDIEVDGKKLCGTGGYFDGSALVFQGTVLIALDRELLTHALNLPAHKLGKRGLETFADRVTDLASLLAGEVALEDVEAAVAGGIANGLGMAVDVGDLSLDEEREAARIHDEEIGTEGFVSGRDESFAREGRVVSAELPTPGGVIAVALSLRDGGEGRVDQVLITGDFFAAHPRVVADLEAHLRQARLGEVVAKARAYLAVHDAGFLGISAEMVVEALGLAAKEAA